MNAALARRFDCEHCLDTRAVNHETLGVIRCPQCTVRAKPRDPWALKEFIQRTRTELSPVEARRVTRAIDVLLIRAALQKPKFPGLPNHLVATDAILERWAAARTGMPAEDPDLYRETRPPELDPTTQEIVSDIVKAAPAGIRKFVNNWYRAHWMTMQRMAEARQMTRRQLGRERERVLVEMRLRFLASSHQDLVRLARLQP